MELRESREAFAPSMAMPAVVNESSSSAIATSGALIVQPVTGSVIESSVVEVPSQEGGRGAARNLRRGPQ